ncbi:MAG TPA: tetratricopeptide repeat protein, partial [Flavobacteriales bacterium]|nr:tetratricopeptide repeat protein [Flavobacteriales bacterium]
MRKSQLHLASIALCLAFTIGILTAQAQSQDARSRRHGYDMLVKGIEQENKDDNEGALKTYALVHRNDSVYEDVLVRRISIMMQTEKVAEALPLCEEGIVIAGEHLMLFHLSKGACLSELKRYDEAMTTYDRAIALYPGSFRLRYLRALCLKEKGDHAAAFKAMQDNAVRFPLQRDAHVALANYALNEGRLSQAALPALMSLVMRWGDKRGEELLIYADKLLDNKFDRASVGLDVGEGDVFAEVDLLLENKVAMNKNYKCEPDLNYPLVRQGHLLLHALKDMPASDGFYSSYYLPFFKKLVASGRFEGFMYHCISNSRDEK